LMDQTAKLAKSSKTTVQRNTLNRHDPPWAVSIPQLLTSQRNKWFSTTLDNSKRLHKWGEFSRSRWSPWCQTVKVTNAERLKRGSYTCALIFQPSRLLQEAKSCLWPRPSVSERQYNFQWNLTSA
jgi:hypothetical protein